VVVLSFFILVVHGLAPARPVPSLAQRFTATYKISHPLSGTLGQGYIYLDYAKYSVRVHAFDPTDFGNITILMVPAKDSPTDFVIYTYHSETLHCSVRPKSPISMLPKFALPEGSTYVTEEKVNAVVCSVWKIVNLPAEIDATVKVFISNKDSTIRKIEATPKKGFISIICEFTQVDTGPISISKFADIPGCHGDHVKRLEEVESQKGFDGRDILASLTRFIIAPGAGEVHLPHIRSAE